MACCSKNETAKVVNAYLARHYSVQASLPEANSILDQCTAVLRHYFGDRPFTFAGDGVLARSADPLPAAQHSEGKPVDCWFVSPHGEYRQMQAEWNNAISMVSPGGLLIGSRYGQNISLTVIVSKHAEVKGEKVHRAGKGVWWLKA